MTCYGIFSSRFAPLTGGIESFTSSLASFLVARGDRAIVVTSRLTEDPEHETLENGVEVWRLPSRPLVGGRFPYPKKGAAYNACLDELADAGIDRVLVNARFYPHSVTGLEFAQRIGAPAVVLDHGSAPIVFGSPLADKAAGAYERHMTKKVKAFSPRFAGISTASTRYLKTLGIDTETVIPNATDADAFRAGASDHDWRSELGCGNETTLVAFVGRLAPEKGAMTLAQAAQLLGDGYVVAFAGDGAQRADIEKLGLANTRLLGNLNHPELSALLRDADVFCLPTRSEGFCTSLLEAASWGLIPVIPRVGGVDEVLGNPAYWGMTLLERAPEAVAEAIKALGPRPAHEFDLVQRTREMCGWKHTLECLDAAFC